ncbi:MAG: hypothetical protein O9295_17335 [Microcystis sp. LE18-22.4A]|nr:hypothetical protein [Microcystis sp. LE19-195.1E]MCZ8119759.1 hypothetical protein [Microcystis sp. LE18-22.4A]
MLKKFVGGVGSQESGVRSQEIIFIYAPHLPISPRNAHEVVSPSPHLPNS